MADLLTSPLLKKKVVVHPIVLLSVVDHYNRSAQGTNRRVVGTILGGVEGGELHVTNSYAVPFEEDASNPMVWYFDHNYNEKMFLMFKKINTKENIIGWYSTGPKCKPADLDIHELYRKHCQQPIYLIVDVNPKEELPIEAYVAVEEPTSDRRFHRTFTHIPTTVGAFEAEEVGLEHLLRDVSNLTASSLYKQMEDRVASLRTLGAKLSEISDYLDNVVKGVYPLNTGIVYMVQEIFNLFPNMEQEELTEAFAILMNDSTLTLYLGSIIRAMLALHDLINNMERNKLIALKKAGE